MSTVTCLDRLRRTQLASAAGALFALSAPIAHATTFVTNCNDSGAGSLRAAVASATEGETVDASALTSASPGCALSRITLSTGEINVTRNALRVKGPGPAKMAVTARYDNNAGSTHQYYNRIFNHSGTGTFEIDDLSISNGYLKPASGDALGGCIYSKGAIKLIKADVRGCTAKVVSGMVKGGGVYAKTSAYTSLTNFSSNTALGANGNYSYGGGIFTPGGIIAKYGEFKLNSADVSGALDARGTLALIHNVTIADNHANRNGAGLTILNPGASITLINSTISGNTAESLVGGAYLSGNNIALYGNTIAYNTAGVRIIFGAGLTVLPAGTNSTLRLESNLIASNSYGASVAPSDFSIIGSATATGGNNLVREPSSGLPPDTIVGKCPLLKPLADNGGPTRTHSLYGHSPAIDAGNNASNSTSDQRGHPPGNGDTVSFTRISGPPGTTPVTDIGAFELDQTEEIFAAGFEGCP